jgi:hypothetical protein
LCPIDVGGVGVGVGSVRTLKRITLFIPITRTYEFTYFTWINLRVGKVFVSKKSFGFDFVKF